MSSGRQNGMSKDGARESVQGIFRLEDVGKPGKAFSDCLGFWVPYIKHLSIRLLNSICKVGATLHNETNFALSQSVF